MHQVVATTTDLGLTDGETLTMESVVEAMQFKTEGRFPCEIESLKRKLLMGSSDFTENEMMVANVLMSLALVETNGHSHIVKNVVPLQKKILDALSPV